MGKEGFEARGSAREGQLYPTPIALETGDGRCELGEADGDAVQHREVGKQTTADASADVFEQSAGNGHFLTHDISHEGIVDGVGKFVGHGGLLVIRHCRHGHEEIASHLALLWQHAMMGTQPNVIQKYLHPSAPLQ